MEGATIAEAIGIINIYIQNYSLNLLKILNLNWFDFRKQN